MVSTTEEVLKKIVLELRTRGILTDVLEDAGVNPVHWMIVKDKLFLFESRGLFYINGKALFRVIRCSIDRCLQRSIISTTILSHCNIDS